MKKYRTIIFVFSIFCLSSCGDYNDKYETFLQCLLDGDIRLLDYYSISENEKQMVWQEEFDNYDTPLVSRIISLLNESDVTANIENDILYVNNESTWRFWFSCFEIEESENYEIELKLWISDYKNHSFSALEYDSLKVNELLFNFNNSSEYIKNEITLRFYFHYNENYYVDFKAENYLKFNQFNTITVRKIDKKTAVFINSKLLYAYYCSPQYSKTIPFIYINQGINKFDYMKISYLHKD